MAINSIQKNLKNLWQENGLMLFLGRGVLWGKNTSNVHAKGTASLQTKNTPLNARAAQAAFELDVSEVGDLLFNVSTIGTEKEEAFGYNEIKKVKQEALRLFKKRVQEKSSGNKKELLQMLQEAAIDAVLNLERNDHLSKEQKAAVKENALDTSKKYLDRKVINKFDPILPFNEIQKVVERTPLEQAEELWNNIQLRNIRDVSPLNKSEEKQVRTRSMEIFRENFPDKKAMYMSDKKVAMPLQKYIVQALLELPRNAHLNNWQQDAATEKIVEQLSGLHSNQYTSTKLISLYITQHFIEEFDPLESLNQIFVPLIEEAENSDEGKEYYLKNQEPMVKSHRQDVLTTLNEIPETQKSPIKNEIITHLIEKWEAEFQTEPRRVTQNQLHNGLELAMELLQNNASADELSDAEKQLLEFII